MTDVESLRSQLRDRGYLSHGIERWFALDPWSSRAFWAELLIVAGKAAVLIALFGSLPCAAVMVARNHPLNAVETLELVAIYAVAWFATGFVVVLAVALLLKIRPALTIDTSRGLLAISIATSSVLIVPLVGWWYEFDALPSPVELATGSVLTAIFFVVVTIVASAALLSFTIYELQRIPAIHQKPRGGPLSVAAVILVALLFVPVYTTPERHAGAPQQVLTVPMQRHLALIGVDGLSDDILRSRPDLAREFTTVQAVKAISGSSTTERWASAGTGVPALLHGVRSVEGVRLAGGAHVLQSVSRADVVLRAVTARQPLPPTIRRRDYVWEIFAGRGVTSVSVNWWTTSDARTGALTSIGQQTIFASAKNDALAVDSGATQRFLHETDATNPQFATIYLPALDVILNRLAAEPSTRLAMSIRALDGALALVRGLRQRGYDVVLVGMPGESQSGRAVVASSINLNTASSPFDVAPTLCSLMGFPASSEMPGQSLAPEVGPRIASYGSRARSDRSPKLNQEYYESLRSLGYIR